MSDKLRNLSHLKVYNVSGPREEYTRICTGLKEDCLEKSRKLHFLGKVLEHHFKALKNTLILLFLCRTYHC